MIGMGKLLSPLFPVSPGQSLVGLSAGGRWRVPAEQFPWAGEAELLRTVVRKWKSLKKSGFEGDGCGLGRVGLGACRFTC